MKKKYITWKEPVYLINLPWPKRETICYDCGQTAIRWDKKGFFKIKEIEHKRERTAIDQLNDIYAEYFDRMFRNVDIFGNSMYGNALEGKKIKIPKVK